MENIFSTDRPYRSVLGPLRRGVAAGMQPGDALLQACTQVAAGVDVG